MDAPLKIKQPKGLADYILRNCANKTYLIFDPKIDLCVCTRCQTKKKISKMNDGDYLKHNRKHFCYECGEEAVCKEWRYGRKNITDYGRILFLTKRGRTTYAQLDEYIINYDRLMIPSVYTWTSAQYKFNSDEQVGYNHHPSAYWSDERWNEMNEIKVPALPVGIYGYLNKFEDTYLYENSTFGTDLKYANLDMSRFGARPLAMAEYIIRYIDAFLKYQSIELLEKSGFENVVRDRISGRFGRGAVYWRGKEIRKILRMNNAEIKEARELRVGLYELDTYRKMKKEYPGYSIKDSLTLYRKMGYNWKYSKVNISKWVPPAKALNYLMNQENMSCSDYSDYLDECNRLGMDMKNKKTLFPVDLAEAHKETSMKCKIEADRLTQENFARFEKEITSMEGPYEFGEYLIRPAVDPEELHKESQALHHCVRTYVNKVARGDSAILFIRRKEEPDKPLFTLELNNEHKIIQCRGLKNCGYPDDVGDLIKHWEKDIVRKIV